MDALALVFLLMQRLDCTAHANGARRGPVEPCDETADCLVGERITQKIDVHIHCGASRESRAPTHDNTALDRDVVVEPTVGNGLQHYVVGDSRIRSVVGIAIALQGVPYRREIHHSTSFLIMSKRNSRFGKASR